MGLFSRFRRRRNDDYVGRHRPGGCGELSLPALAEAVDVAAVQPVAVASAPPTPPPLTAPVPTTPVAGQVAAVHPNPVPVAVRLVEISARQRVRLAFADGSSVDIEDASADSHQLQHLATRLLGE
jgi:hypothetical protein